MFVSDTKRSWRGGLDYALAESVKCRDSYTIASLIRDWYTHLFEAVLHLLSRFVREGNGDNVARPDSALSNQVRNAVRDDARLTRTRARQNQQGPVAGSDGFALRFVELGKEFDH